MKVLPSPSPKSQNTRIALIECAESLFGEHGIQGVSLRQIGAASGSANSGVIAYHFGTKQALLTAVIEYRLHSFEKRRSELLAQAQDTNQPIDLLALMDILFRPLFEQIDLAGRHSYAAFLAALCREDLTDIRQTLAADYPVTQQLISRVKESLPAAAAPLFPYRIQLASSMVFAGIRHIDLTQQPPDEAAALFHDALIAAAAAIAAQQHPVP